MHPSHYIYFYYGVVIIDLYHLGIRILNSQVYYKAGGKILSQKLTVFILTCAALRLLNYMHMLFQ